ncbi:MAG: hypothetical protein CL768_04410 [Chloroflexi bacterium]|nr:hypothetical protein [Chloroflexota bacterium]|tara:strand:- start:90 stop:563 length:474 start_codon:yes stop_codon:yes gene_type:complete
MVKLSSEIAIEIREVLESLDTKKSTVLSTLLAIHDELHYLPKEAIEEVASYKDVSINDVWGVATFYTNFRISVPPTKHQVEVCWGPTCHLMGAGAVLGAVQRELDLSDEGDTADGRVCLKYNTCIGACSQAPVMMVDHKIIGKVTSESAIKLLKELD